MICAILIGREGSEGFPGKNIYPVLGRPLMVYPILAAKGSKYIDQLYVSTDSQKIKKIAESYKCKVIDRPAHLCTAEARCENVFIHAYDAIKKEVKQESELLPLLMCNAPMITSEKIDEGIEVLRRNSEYDSAVTVSRYNMFSPLRARKIEGDGLLHPFVPHECFCQITKMDSIDSDRDSQGDCWFADMGVSVIRPRNLLHIEKGLLPQKWMGQKIYPLKQEGGFDIDYEWELPSVEYWLRKHGFTETTPSSSVSSGF
jgi:hypothetical protein